MSPQGLLSKAQDSIFGSGMGHKVGFHSSSGFFHHSKHMALGLVGLWE